MAGAPGGSGSFAGVSCTQTTDCTAVGVDGSGDPIFATETGGVLGQCHRDSPAPTGTTGSFASVSCASIGACTAVGGDGNGQPIYATESGGGWGTATELPTSGTASVHRGTCSEPTDRSAIGTSAGEALYSNESAGVWSTPTTIAVRRMHRRRDRPELHHRRPLRRSGLQHRRRGTRTGYLSDPDRRHMECACHDLSAG